MPTFKEINEKRKSGCLEEAYKMAESELKDHPDDIWAKRAMGWVLYEYLDQNATSDKVDTFVTRLTEFVNLKFDASERMLYKNIAWPIRKLMDSYKDNNSDTAPIDQVLKLIKDIPFPKEEDSYGAMLQAAISIDDKWANCHQFIEWWNLDNLKPANYLSYKMPNGREVMSLGERAYITYSKWVLAFGHQEETENILPKLKKIVADYPGLVYPPFYLGKLLLKAGQNDEAIEVLKPFAKSKSKDFWVWQLLGDAHTDTNARLSFYSKALDCGGMDEMLVALHEDAAAVFADAGYPAAAKWETDKAISIRNRKGWHITANLAALTQTDWYKNTQASPSNNKFYDEQKEAAEEFLYGARKEITVLITNYNHQNYFTSFVTEEKKEGFFKWPKRQKTPPAYTLATIKITQIAEKGPTQVFGVSIGTQQENEQLLKHFEGTLKKNEKGFGFINQIYIESKFLSNKNSGETIKGMAAISYNQKKKEWGWKAVKIE